MLTKTLLFAIIAACGVQSNPATNPNEQLGGDPHANAKAAAAARDFHDAQMQTQMQLYSAPEEIAPPKENAPKDQHFCCHSVDPKNWSGDGCVTIAPTQIDQCNEVLDCPGKWAKHDGKVTCE